MENEKCKCCNILEGVIILDGDIPICEECYNQMLMEAKIENEKRI